MVSVTDAVAVTDEEAGQAGVAVGQREAERRRRVAHRRPAQAEITDDEILTGTRSSGRAAAVIVRVELVVGQRRRLVVEVVVVVVTVEEERQTPTC